MTSFKTIARFNQQALLKLSQGVLCVIIIIYCTGCASGYGSYSNWTATGFKEKKLADNIYLVEFDGNGFTSEERAADFALLWGCEIAKANSYSYLAVRERRARKIATGAAMPFIRASLQIVYFKEKPDVKTDSFDIYNADEEMKSLRAKYQL